MKIFDELLTVYSGEIETRGDKYVVEVPKREIEHGGVREGAVHRIAVLSQIEQEDSEHTETPESSPQRPAANREQAREIYNGPPVEAGDQRVVVIESTGEEGDGIAKVDRGYVVIVPEASQGDKVRIELNTVRENVGFADVVEFVD